MSTDIFLNTVMVHSWNWSSDTMLLLRRLAHWLWPTSTSRLITYLIRVWHVYCVLQSIYYNKIENDANLLKPKTRPPEAQNQLICVVYNSLLLRNSQRYSNTIKPLRQVTRSGFASIIKLTQVRPPTKRNKATLPPVGQFNPKYVSEITSKHKHSKTEVPTRTGACSYQPAIHTQAT